MENARSLVLVVSSTKVSEVVTQLKNQHYCLQKIYESNSSGQDISPSDFTVLAVSVHMYYGGTYRLDAYQVLDKLIQSKISLHCQVGIIEYPIVGSILIKNTRLVTVEAQERINILQRLLPAYHLPQSQYWEKHFMTFPCHCRSYQSIARKCKERVPEKLTYGFFGKMAMTFHKMAALL